MNDSYDFIVIGGGSTRFAGAAAAGLGMTTHPESVRIPGSGATALELASDYAGPGLPASPSSPRSQDSIITPSTDHVFC